MPKVIGSMDDQLDIKRCHLPGIKIEDNCPSCLKPVHWDGDSDYVSYPKVNSPIDFHFYCADCDREWDVQATIALTINL
jgi:hypothetical protein